MPAFTVFTIFYWLPNLLLLFFTIVNFFIVIFTVAILYLPSQHSVAAWKVYIAVLI